MILSLYCYKLFSKSLDYVPMILFYFIKILFLYITQNNGTRNKRRNWLKRTHTLQRWYLNANLIDNIIFKWRYIQFKKSPKRHISSYYVLNLRRVPRSHWCVSKWCWNTRRTSFLQDQIYKKKFNQKHKLCSTLWY